MVNRHILPHLQFSGSVAFVLCDVEIQSTSTPMTSKGQDH